MTSDVLEGKWHELKGSVREKWGKLSDDDVEQIGGSFEKLAGTVQQKYGKTRAEAEKEISDWLNG